MPALYTIVYINLSYVYFLLFIYVLYFNIYISIDVNIIHTCTCMCTCTTLITGSTCIQGQGELFTNKPQTDNSLHSKR